jgi:hypothetical protein
VHQLDVDEAERVIEEMRGGESEQHKPGRDPKALCVIPSEQDVHGLPIPYGRKSSSQYARGAQ